MKTLRMFLAVLCIAVITACAALLFSRFAGRARVQDLTEDQRYTLSNGTRNLLAKLNQPLTLKLYYSRNSSQNGPDMMKDWNSYFLYVEDLLREYAAISNGKIQLQVIDPRTFSEEEDDAVAAGLHRVPFNDRDSFFFGLVAVSELGKQKVIPFLDRGRDTLVEYDVSKLIADLVQRDKRKIGVISTLPVTGQEISPQMMQMLQMQGRPRPQPWMVTQYLQESFEVVPVTQAHQGHIPEDIDLLLVVHPKDLKEPVQFAIDQYVMRGKPVVILQDPYCLLDQHPQSQQQPWMRMAYWGESELNSLTARWGLRMQTKRLAVDRTLGIAVPLQQNTNPVKFPPFIGLDDSCMNDNQPVTAELNQIQMLFAGYLEEVADVKDVTVVSLLETTPEGAVWVPQGASEIVQPNVAMINRTARSNGEPLILAALLRGTFQTNFPDGIDLPPPPDAAATGPAMPPGGMPLPVGDDDDDDDATGDAEATAAGSNEDDDAAVAEEPTVAEPTHLDAIASSASGAEVVVISDVDMMTDNLAFQRSPFGPAPMGQNLALILNLIDYLGGDKDLLQVRERGTTLRPLQVIEDMKDEADQATRDQMLQLNLFINAKSEELKQFSGSLGDSDQALLANEALKKRREIEEELRQARSKMRKIQSSAREEVETLEWKLQLINCAAAPGAILLLGLCVGLWRLIRARMYQARRA